MRERTSVAKEMALGTGRRQHGGEGPRADANVRGQRSAWRGGAARRVRAGGREGHQCIEGRGAHFSGGDMRRRGQKLEETSFFRL
jgi:hypothetical protein